MPKRVNPGKTFFNPKKLKANLPTSQDNLTSRSRVGVCPTRRHSVEWSEVYGFSSLRSVHPVHGDSLDLMEQSISLAIMHAKYAMLEMMESLLVRVQELYDQRALTENQMDLSP